MKKIKLKLNSETLGEIKNSCEGLKNCTVLKPEICISLQRNIKSVKNCLIEIQDAADLLRENSQLELKEDPSKNEEITKKYNISIKKLIQDQNEIELFVFNLSEFEDKDLGSREVIVQNQNGEVVKTQTNFIESFLPLIDVLIYDTIPE